MNLLVTGGAGYIGSHTVIELLTSGHSVTIFDNFSNSSPEVVDRVRRLASILSIPDERLRCINGDLLDSSLLREVFCSDFYDGVLHFAGLKSVEQSCHEPLQYFHQNLCGSIALFNAMSAAGVSKLIFSSSATVYGRHATMPVAESSALGGPTNPYGRTKLILEEVLADLARSDSSWSVGILRYFNPVGAHQSGLIGESPVNVPTNLVPVICRVALGVSKELVVYGGDYSTHDGTCVRDYIHVSDLAKGHISALQKLNDSTGVKVWNLGTGKGHSVLEMIHAFEKVSGVTIPYTIQDRRVGDVEECWADVRKANDELDWSASCGLDEMMTDTWRWLLNAA